MIFLDVPPTHADLFATSAITFRDTRRRRATRIVGVCSISPTAKVKGGVALCVWSTLEIS